MVFQMLLNTFFYPFYIFIDLLSHVNIIYICIFKELAYSKRVFFYSKGLIGQHTMSPYFDHLFVTLIILI